MLKSKNGNVKIEGNTPEIMHDLAVLIHALYNECLLKDMPEEEAKDFVQYAVYTGLKTESEIEKEMQDMKDDILDRIENVLELIKAMKEKGAK